MKIRVQVFSLFLRAFVTSWFKSVVVRAEKKPPAMDWKGAASIAGGCPTNCSFNYYAASGWVLRYNPSMPRWILTETGFGYRFDPASPAHATEHEPADRRLA